MIRKLLFLLALLTSCGNQDKEEVELVRQTIEGIIEADNHSDLEKVMSFYHDNAVLFPTGKPSIAREEAIRENYKQIFSSWRLELETKIEETRAAADWAFVTGRNKGTRISLSDGSTEPIDDQFTMLLEKQDGEWKIRKLWWNQNPETTASSPK